MRESPSGTLDLPTGSRRRGGTGTARGPQTFKFEQDGWEPALREAREFKSGVETLAFTQARADWESALWTARGPVRASDVAALTRLISDPGRGGRRGPQAGGARQVHFVLAGTSGRAGAELQTGRKSDSASRGWPDVIGLINWREV